MADVRDTPPPLPAVARDRPAPTWPRSISTRIALAFCSLFFVAWLLIQWIELYGLPGGMKEGWLQHIRQEELQRIGSTADVKKGHLEGWIKERRNDLAVLARSSQLVDALKWRAAHPSEAAGDPHRPRLRAWMEHFQDIYGVYDSVMIVDRAFRDVLADGKEGGRARVDRESIEKMLQPGQEETHLVRSEAGQGTKLVIARQILDSGAALGVVVLIIDLENEIKAQIEGVLEDFLGQSGEVILYDPHGRFLHAPRYPLPPEAGSGAPMPVDHSRLAQLAVRGGEGAIQERDYRAVPVLAAYRHVRVSPDVGWGLVVKKDEDEVLRRVREHATSFALMGLVALGFVFIASLLIARRIAWPVRQISQASREIQAGNHSARAQVTGHSEVADLAHTFNALADKFQEWHTELDSQVRRQTEIIRSQEGRMLAFSETTNDAVVAIDGRGAINYWNPAAERIFGYTAEEALGQDVHRLLALPGQVDAAREGHLRFADSGQSPLLGRVRELPARTRSGQRIVVELNISPLEVRGEWHAVGTLRDITRRKKEEGVLRTIAEQLSVKVGDEYFKSLASTLARQIEADYVIVGELIPGEVPRITTVGAVTPAGLVDNFDYALPGTPCHNVMNGGLSIYRDGAQALFPEDKLLVEMGVQAYAGTPLSNKEGRPIGLIAALWRHAIADGDEAATYLRIFAARAGAELERAQAERDLDRYTQKLEDMVDERTGELVEVIATLKQAHHELVEAEKLASLGRLVAGVAHELNTPIGNCVTVSTTLSERVRVFREIVAGGTVRRSTLNEFSDDIERGAHLLESSLRQAAELIHDFKQVAVDQTSSQRRPFNLKTVVEEIVMTLRPRLKKTTHRLLLDIAGEIDLDGYPGPLGQVLTNMIENALVHALENCDNGTIAVLAERMGPATVAITVRDDGCGMTEEVRARIFDPFFTTKLGRGGSGLGMNIVYNIVTGILGGKILIDSAPGAGTSFRIELPVVAPQPAGRG